jgi:hypothetical protein
MEKLEGGDVAIRQIGRHTCHIFSTPACSIGIDYTMKLKATWAFWRTFRIVQSTKQHYLKPREVLWGCADCAQ